MDTNEQQGDARKALLLEVLAELDDYVAVWNRDLRLVYANKRLEKLWNAREQDYLGKTLQELPFSTVKSEVLEGAIRQVFSSAKPLSGDFPYARPHGETGYAEFSCTPLRDRDGNVTFVSGVARDATARKETELALAENERQYRLLFETIDQGFCLVEVIEDENGQSVDFLHLKTNPAFKRMTGIQEAEGRLVSEVVPGLKDRWGETWSRVARTGVPERIVGKSSSLGRWFDTSIFPLEGPRSRRIAFLFSDVTQQKSEELALQEADRRKDEFLAALGHELRNPLGAIRTALEVLALADRNSAMHDEAHATIERQSRQLVALVDDLLEISRIKQGKVELHKETVDLAEIIQGAVEAVLPQARQAEQEITLALPLEPVPLLADAHRLTQIFTNLLNNASKYTPSGGKISLEAQVEGSRVEVAVIDTGMGIRKDMQARIFDMFVQVRQNQQSGFAGLGLGLTLCRSLVEMHGGTIRVESAGEGKGSAFHVSLPLQEDPRAAAVKPQAGRTPPEVKARILVVDDNSSGAKMLAALIGLLGCEAQCAFSGVEAIRAARTFRPDVIIMDLAMPDIDGFEAARRIRGEWGPSLKLIALSGWGQDEDRQKAREAGFDAHWVKPVEMQDLQGLLAGFKGE